MFLKPSHPRLWKIPAKQQGSMLVIALFVIIVLALLGLTMTRLLSSSSDTIIYEVLGQRALNAARAGIECAAMETLNNSDEPCVADFTEFNGVPGLENCSYRVQIPAAKSIADGAKNFIYRSFRSTGQCRAGNINVTRVVFIDAML